MRKFLCSLLLVLSVLFSMAQNYTSNGGTLEFVSGGSGNMGLVGCVGSDFSITIIDNDSEIATITADDTGNPTLTYANGQLSGNLTGTVSGTQYLYTVKDSDGDELGKFVLVVMDAPETPTITSTETTFSAGEQYVFTASSNTSGVTYKWTLAGDGASIVGDNNMESVTVAFNSTLDQGTFQLICEVSNNGCTVVGSKNIEVSSGATQQDITYTALDATLCRGDNMAYTITASESIPSTTTLKMTVGLESFTGYSKGDSYTFDLSGMTPTSGTFNAEIVDITNDTTIATPTITVNASPDVVISSTEQSFSTGTSYEFTATSDASNGTYMWSMGTYPDGGTYEFVNGYSSQSTTIKFNTAGQYELLCAVTDANGCSSNNFTYVTVEGGTVSDITYTAQPQTFCYKNDGQYEYVVNASQAVEEDDYIMVLLSYSSYYGSHHSDAIDGDEIYFRLNNLPAAEYEVMIYSSDSLNLLVDSASLTVGAPIRPTISWEDGEFYVNETVSFYNENYDETLSYTWSVDNADHTFVGATDGEGVSITFLNTGDFVVKCEATENGCTSSDTYSLEVVNVVCSIDGTKYSTLTEALQAVQSGDEIIVLNDIDEEEGNVDVNKSFTLNTNNHVVSFGQISGMANRTITGGGVLNTALDNSNTNGSDSLTIDNATLNLNGSQWMAKGLISLVNGASVTLTSEIFLGGGDEDGFNLSIDGTSSFNINGQNIGGYNCARIADQMSPYIPDNYTVSADGESLVFSPDANVILGAQPQQIERTYYVFGKAVACNGETTTVQIAAPQGFANAANLSITNADKLTFESSVVDTLLTVELPAGTYYLYDNGEDPVLEFSVTEETITDLEISGSETVEILGELGQNDMGWTYYVPYTEGNTYEWTCSGDVSVTSERMGSSHWATVRFTTPGSYVLSCTETNTNGCSHTVTKDVTVKQYTYTIPQDNVVLCSGDGASVTVIITCNTVEGFNEQFAVAKDYTTDTLASYTIEEGDGLAKAHVTITEQGTYNLYYGGNLVADVYYRNQINSLSFTVTEETITATITGPTTATVDEEVTYSVTASSTLPNATLTYSWGGGVENSLESDLMAVGSFSTSDIGEAEVSCLVESENGCSYEAKLAVTVEEAQPVVSVSFPQDEYEITIGDSTYVCLNITSEEPNFNLDLVTIALDDTEGGVQFMETQNKGCFYIKALSTAGSSTEVSATVTYNNKEYYATTLVRFKEAPFEWENCPDAPLNFEDGSYELQISQLFDVSSYSYSWSSSNEDVATVAADGTVTFVAPGYAEILCTATNLYDQTGVVQAQCPLHIEGETEFTISEKSTLTVCQGESATVVITAEPAASFIVVSADNETIYTADNEDYVTLTPTMTTAGDYTYYIVEDGTQKKSFTITVNEKPTVTITALQSVVCVGDTVQLEAIMNLSDGSYYWSGADNFNDATSGNPKFVASSVGQQTITCTVTGAGNCQETAETSVMVYPKPTVTISGPTEVTVDTEVEYTATLSTSNIPATATFTYAWGGGVESYDTETIAKGSFRESDIEEGAEVFCIVSTTDGTCADTAKYPVTVKAVPATFWATDTVFCYDATGFVTIESSEAINTAAFGVQTADGTSVNFEPVVSSDNNQNNVVVIEYENLSSGTYYITSKGEPVGSFQVVVNYAPRATFSCPTSDEAVVDETWNVSAPMAEGATYNYMWSSDGISFNDASSATQSITFETAGPVWVALSVEDAETGCVSNSDTCRFTIVEGEQKYIVPEEVTWCHGENSGHVAFTVTSNKDIPESLTVNHEWASNIQVDVYGKEASIEFDYPYAGRQGFQLITINDDDNDGINDTTIVVENVNAYGKGYLQAGISTSDGADTIVNFAETQEIILEASCLETIDICSSCGSGATFSWSYDEESIDGECLEWVNSDTQECNNSKMKFTFSQAGTYTFEAQTHQNGCSSEWTSKTIYVVPFNPALFTISPEKDTIEIGDADGVQLTLSYDGEEYAGEYALRTDGDLTIDGSTVYDNEITGTFEVKAIVSDVVVAKAWVTVLTGYTFENLVSCENEEKQVVITASAEINQSAFSIWSADGSIIDVAVEGNTATINNPAAGVYNIFEGGDVPVKSFTVEKKSAPRAAFTCPTETETIVGETWNVSAPMVEGATYNYMWSSDGISFNDASSATQSITFETAGPAWVVLSIEDAETGCVGNSDTCRFTISNINIDYTVDNVSVCEGTDEAVAVISASGSIYGRTVTVRDEDDNTFYPEYNDDNDAATVHLNYLSVGTYTYKVYEDDVYKTEFTVTVNSLPTASIECPQNPVVGDTWSPNTAAQEGISYAWVSDEITSLNGSTACCPQVTFTEAGDFSATLVVKNNETGCLSEGATCEFTVGEKAQEYFLNCPDGDLSLGESYYVMFLNAGDATGKTLTWSTSDEEIVSLAPDSDNGQCVVNFKQVGTAQIYCQVAEPTGEVLEMVACTLNIVQPKAVYFSQGTYEVENGTPTTICLTAEGLDLTNAQITYEVSNDKILSVEPSVAATGCAVLTSGVTTTETLSIVAIIVVGEETYEATADVHVVEPFVCDGTIIEGGTPIDLSFDEMAVGDQYRLVMSGTSAFTGVVNIMVEDFAAPATTSNIISKMGENLESYYNFDVYEGEPFEINALIEIDKSVSSDSHNYKLYVRPMPNECPTGYDESGSPVCYGKLCQTYYSFTKEEDFVCEGHQVYGWITRDGIDDAKVGDKYTMTFSGTSNFDGTVAVAAVNRDMSGTDDLNYTPISESYTFSVSKGQSFDYAQTIEITQSISSEDGLYQVLVVVGDGEDENQQICLTNMEIKKETTVKEFAMSEPQFSMMVGNTKTIWLLGDGQPYYGDVEWNVYDLSGSTVPCVNVDYGEVYAQSAGQAKIEAKVNGTVVATAMVSVSEFTCDGQLYSVTGDNAYFTVKTTSEIVAGETYRVELEGTTDFDGAVMVTCGDFSSEEPAQGAGMAKIVVQAGVPFTYTSLLTIQETASSTPNYNFMVALTGENEESRLCATKLEFTKFEAKYTLDAQNEIYIGTGKMLTLRNIDGSVYGGEATWSSSDPNVATVEKGYVYGVDEGVTEIQAFIGGELAASTTVAVSEGSGVAMWFDEAGYTLNVNEELPICVQLYGMDFPDVTYSYDESVIELNAATTGWGGANCKTIKGLKAGSTMLRAAAVFDGETYTASAIIEVKGGSTSDDYTLAFSQSKYEITEGESISACLTIGEGFEHFDPSFTFDQTVISIANPTDNSDCGTVTGLKAGSTMINLSAVAPDGNTYTAITEVIVNAKQLPYFVKQSIAIEVGESEQITVMSFDGGSAQASLFTFETSDATVATVGRDGVVTAIAVGNAEVSVFYEGSLVGKVAVAVDVAPQMPTPAYNTNVLTMCFDKSATTNGGTSLERMVYPTSDFGKLKWYDASGNELSAAPVVSAAQAGKAVYYVSQIGMGELANYRESEKVPYTVEIVYVAEPKLNVTDQSTCQGATAVPFVATTNTENVVEWTDVTGAVVAQGTEFLPQVPTSGYYTYKVTAKNTMGCVSNPLTVTYTVGNAVKPEIFVATQAESFVVGEPVTLGTSNQMSDDYSVVWSLGDNEYVHGTAFTMQFDEVGTYTVTCKVVETNTGCADSASKVITVEEKVIPLQSIVVEPETVTLYEGEQGYVSLAFEPSYASNMAYTIEVEDTEVADVAGLTVWAVAEGTTKATITSVENPDVKAEFNIVVNKLIKAKEISMPNIITLALNEETKVAASVIPAEASYNKVAFKEKTDNVISIDAEGNVKALGEGTSIIVAYSNGGLQATAVVYVTAAQTAITDIAVPDEIELKLRDSVVVSYKVTPVTLAAKLLEWAIENNDIATFSNGVVKAVSAGETNLTVSIGNISKTIKIKVTTSSAPVIGVAPKLAFEQGKNITVDFADFVSDDETELANLTFEATSDDLNVSIDGMVATITAKSDSYAGTTSFTLSVTDEDGLTTSADVPVEVTEKANQAPVVLIEDVQIKYNACTYLKLSDIFSDDNTSWKKLKYTFTAKNVSVKVCMKTQLSMISTNPDLEYDTLFVTVTDAEGLTTEAEVIMYVNSLPNRAPKIAEIPVQSETDDAAFGTIELANYVKDDYTAASSIKWTTSSSDNLSVIIDEGVASVEVLNAFWNGAEAITFYAADEEGLKDSTIVYYSRKVTINEETVSSGSDNELTPVVWEGAPVVNIMAMKFIGVPGEQFIIMASMSGYDCTWAWEIEGANGIDQTSLMQMVSFDNPGTYTVKLTVQSVDGQHSIEVVKENLLTVVGINERTPAICKGDAVTLTASEGLDSYYWSTGDVKNTTTARPDATTLYKLTMKKGMFTLVDTVTVKVSVPVALMEDSVMCAGTTFDLEAIGDYVSYAWNTGDVEKSITIPSEVASYTVTAVDGMQCVSVDTFNLTKVNDLPAIDLGEDQTPCDGTTVTLDAGAGYEYLWSTGATSQTINLTANTETVWARIIDANKCINYDTVVVAFTYPYPEQIGVATFSQTTDHIILAWEKTAGVNTAKYRIERETNVTDNWEQVGDDVMFSEAGIVVDEDVNYKKRAYKYRLVTTDGCGNEAVSEVHRSMISTTTRNDDGTKTLQWCAYEPMSNVTQYLVLRGYDATKMDTVDQVPASNMFEIWNETESQFVNDENIKYRVVFRLKSEVNENAVNTLDGQPVEGYYTKAESGPFSLAMSNIAEVETDVSVSEIAFPADVIVYPTTVSSYINVAIASPEDSNFIVEVLNANGQVVARVQTGEISKTLLQISAEGLRQGVYTVRISDGQQSTSVKVVK